MDEILQQLSDINKRLTDIENQFKQHRHTGLDSQQVPGIPSALASAPLAAITKPSGGITQDVSARAAISTVIDDLKTLGLTL